MALQCNYCSRSHIGKVNQSDYRKITIHFRKGGRGPISSSQKKKSYLKQRDKIQIQIIDSKHLSRKQNVSLYDVFLFETLHIIPTRHIFLTQGVTWSSPSNFIATIAMLCNNIQSQVKSVTSV